MQKIMLIGNLTKDVEIKATTNGKLVARFTLAVERPNTTDTTDFFDIVVWEKLAENCSQYLGKGLKVFVEGILTTRTYQDKDGYNRKVYEIKANSVEFLSKKLV